MVPPPPLSNSPSMSNATPRHVVVAACLVALGVLTVGLIVDTTTRADEGLLRAKPDEGPQRVVVLVGGGLLEGDVSESASGYVVERPKGRVVVPFESVLLTAASRPDAYEKRRRTLSPPSPGNHYRLAQWCLRYGMNTEAKRELRTSLALAADFEPARELLVNIDRLENPITPRSTQVNAAPLPRTRDGYERPAEASIAGLAPETAKTFATRVQPLLVNGCGNARCHGGRAENGLHLERPHGRSRAQRNLAAALEYVDLDDPTSSPLLVQPSGPHGPGNRPVFVGSGGRTQRELLAEWVRDVARDLGPKRDRPERSPVVTASREEPADRREPGDRDEPSTTTNARRAPNLLDRILDEERPDAFDPDAFNRGR